MSSHSFQILKICALHNLVCSSLPSFNPNYMIYHVDSPKLNYSLVEVCMG